MNYYTFQNLNGTSQYFNQNSDYSPQKSREVQEELSVLDGSSIVLRTDVGKNLANPSLYRWYKNDIAIQETPTAADSISLNCIPPGFSEIPECYECVGNYYVQVTNPDFPGIALRSAL